MTFALLLALLCQSPAEGTADDLAAELTIILEFGDNALRAHESWRIRNPAGRTIPASALQIAVPANASSFFADKQTQNFEAKMGNLLVATAPLSGPEGYVGSTYALPIEDAQSAASRKLSLNVDGVRVIMQKLPGLTLESPQANTPRERDLQGQQYLIWDFPPAARGSELSFRVSGLPSAVRWPKQAALALIALIGVWAVFAFVTGRVPGKEELSRLGPLSAKVRRDRLVRALELLEDDLRAEKVSEKKYQRRHQELLAELAVVLRELDLEERRLKAAEAG